MVKFSGFVLGLPESVGKFSLDSIFYLLHRFILVIIEMKLMILAFSRSEW